jgi:ribonuclease HI
VGVRNAHQAQWKAFTSGLVEALATRLAELDRPLVFMLWGGPARTLASLIRHACEKAGKPKGFHTILEWSHPSPLANNRLPFQSKFEQCGHFGLANARLRERGARVIAWDTLAYNFVSIDGACKGNGKPGARASFAAFFANGPLRDTTVKGVVAPYEYRFRDPENPLQGFELVPETEVAPSNNRGEYLAGCWAFLLLLRARVRGRVEVVSDSNLFIQTIEEWLPKRKTKGTERQLKNYDLVEIADTLVRLLRDGPDACTALALTHTSSHQKEPPASAPARERLIWIVNDRVDKIAQQICHESDETPGTVILDSDVWCVHDGSSV